MFDKYLAWVIDSFQSEQGFCLKWPLAWFCFEKDVKEETLAKEETFTSISREGLQMGLEKEMQTNLISSIACSLLLPAFLAVF